MIRPPLRRATDSGVAVVILNWNRWPDTVACLESLRRLDGPAPHVIVVDNGSHDRSAEHIRSAFPSATVIEAGRNLGFAGGSNLGIRQALGGTARFVWLLNNDTVVAPDALVAMTDVMEGSDEVGIVGSVVRRFAPLDSVEAWGGGTVNAYLATTRRVTMPGKGRLDYVAGTSMLIRREVFEDVGILDEDFFFYMEDVDFSCRAVACGWRLAVAPKGIVFHKGGATVNNGDRQRSGRADRHHVRSSGVFIGRHAGRWTIPSATVRLAGITARRVMHGKLHKLPELSREFLEGVVVGVRGRR